MRSLFIFIIIFLIFVNKNIYAEIININPSEMKKLMMNNIPLIDIRREDEWKLTGVIKNSHLHTFFDRDGKYDFKNFVETIKKIENVDNGIILFCRTGRRTTIIANALEKTEIFKIIYNTKGIKDWISENNKLIVYK